MPVSEIPLLIFFVGVFVLFGGVLGWASWRESRDHRAKAAASNTHRA